MRRFLAVFDPSKDGDKPLSEIRAMAVRRARSAGCEVVDGDIEVEQHHDLRSWSPIIATVPVIAERNQYIHLGSGPDVRSWPPQTMTSSPRTRYTGQRRGR